MIDGATLDLFQDVKTEPSLDLCARQIVVASYLYYRHDVSMMSDGEFDKMCQRVADNWDQLDPVRSGSSCWALRRKALRSFGHQPFDVCCNPRHGNGDRSKGIFSLRMAAANGGVRCFRGGFTRVPCRNR
jgi:hypothetical protein